jgi:hypothetical protein
MKDDSRKPFSREEKRRLQLAAHTALWVMNNGTARREEWADLSDAINVVEALCDMGKLDGDLVMHWITRAIDGMVSAARIAPGRMRMPAEHAVCLRHVVAHYDYAIERLSRGSILGAREAVIRKIVLASAEGNHGLIVVDIMSTGPDAIQGVSKER